MNFTQYLRIFFRDSKSYKHIDPKIKSQMSFMLNRILARKYPLNAKNLNINGIDTYLTSEVWYQALSPRFTDVPDNLSPNWAKLKKKSENPVLKDFTEVDKQILMLYPELIEEAKEELDSKKKIEKDGTIKVTKKRGRSKK